MNLKLMNKRFLKVQFFDFPLLLNNFHINFTRFDTDGQLFWAVNIWIVNSWNNMANKKVECYEKISNSKQFSKFLMLQKITIFSNYFISDEIWTSAGTLDSPRLTINKWRSNGNGFGLPNLDIEDFDRPVLLINSRLFTVDHQPLMIKYWYNRAVNSRIMMGKKFKRPDFRDMCSKDSQKTHLGPLPNLHT